MWSKSLTYWGIWSHHFGSLSIRTGFMRSCSIVFSTLSYFCQYFSIRSTSIHFLFAYSWSLMFSVAVVHYTFPSRQDFCAARIGGLTVHRWLLWRAFWFILFPISSASASATFFLWLALSRLGSSAIVWWHSLIPKEPALFLVGLQAMFVLIIQHGFITRISCFSITVILSYVP